MEPAEWAAVMLPVEPVKSSNNSFVFAFMGVDFIGLLNGYSQYRFICSTL